MATQAEQARDPATPPEQLLLLAEAALVTAVASSDELELAAALLSNPSLPLLFVGDWAMWASITGRARVAVARARFPWLRKHDAVVAASRVAPGLPGGQRRPEWWLAYAEAYELQAAVSPAEKNSGPGKRE